MALLDRIENSSAEVILSIALILFAGFLMTRITKKLHLPDVTGYILAGVLIGPYVLNLVSTDIMEGMGFITDIALAYIAFGVGKYFKLEQLKKNGKRIIIITAVSYTHLLRSRELRSRNILWRWNMTGTAGSK